MNLNSIIDEIKRYGNVPENKMRYIFENIQSVWYHNITNQHVKDRIFMAFCYFANNNLLSYEQTNDLAFFFDDKIDPDKVLERNDIKN